MMPDRREKAGQYARRIEIALIQGNYDRAGEILEEAREGLEAGLSRNPYLVSLEDSGIDPRVAGYLEDAGITSLGKLSEWRVGDLMSRAGLPEYEIDGLEVVLGDWGLQFRRYR